MQEAVMHWPCPRFTLPFEAVFPNRGREMAAKGRMEFFEEKNNFSPLTVWECLSFRMCQENATAKLERIHQKSIQNMGAEVD